MDSEILELENKLLHSTAEPISLPLYFLKLITGDFSKKQELGRGGYGAVYKGLLHQGNSFIAVKKIHDSYVVQHDEQFQKEATFLMGIEHPNVVRLLGYCSESKGEITKLPNGKYVVADKHERMLCFEYLCNGGLDKHLSDSSSGLEWNTRYEIIKGICNGLNFLHECNIVHLDLKPQNILMDTNMVPKIADFGLSRLLGKQKSYTVTVTLNRAGSMGYMAPEYIFQGKISKKADIFSLGVIIIEILKGCREYPLYPQSSETDIQQFIEKVFGNWRNRFERASKYTALGLHTQQVKQCINIALKCVHPDRERRPNTLDIIKILEATENSSCPQIGEYSSPEYQMRNKEGVPPELHCEDGLADLNRSAMKDHSKTRIIKEMPNKETLHRALDRVKSAVAPHQRKPILACVDSSFAALCYQGARNASFWVTHKALSSLENNLLLKGWVATVNLSTNVDALKLQLLSVKGILKSTLGKVIPNMAHEDSLMVLQDLLYDAEDVVDEMEYFRIQDMLHSTSDADDQHANEPPKLRFDRDNAFQRINHIVEQLQLVRQDISSTITLMGSEWSTTPNISQSCPITVSESIELKLYGRKLMMKSIIDDITMGKHYSEVLTVIPIVGPGGIGKTTLAWHIYHNGEVQEHFDVRVWTRVSLNFDVKKLLEEIQRCVPRVDRESIDGTIGELIEQRLKNKRLLLVLDDIWDCNDKDEWKQLLVPFEKSQVHGSIIIVTTRFPSQAQIMIQKKDHSIYLQGIQNKEFEELFLDIIFGDDDQSRKDHIFLLETGLKIAGKLKGSPLAAKTVGTLLKKQLDFVHWTRILESKEWEHSDDNNDIMPALKLSFDYLPSHLQQCFSYCALFPQNYIFESEELIMFWIGLDVLHSSHAENKRAEDIGLGHLTELVNYGFLEKKKGKYGRTCYIIHDLLHELARKVSSLECLRIDSSQSQVSSLRILPSVRHLSIIINDISVKNRSTLKSYIQDFNTLIRLKVEKLRTLMLFGEHHGCFVKAFAGLFKEAKALRLVFLSGASYDVKYLLHNFYYLIHLRYLRIESSSLYKSGFPDRISRFYNMMVIDAKHCGIIDLPRDMSNLVNLRHFLVGNDSMHSRIAEVGKLKSLQELRRFMVKQEGQGFELREIGHLVQLRGSLSICNLENVQVKEEAEEAKLMQKSHLHELILHWDNLSGIFHSDIDRCTYDSVLGEQVLERLIPCSNLQKLTIIGHGGDTCPLWLGTNLSVKNLESLCLYGVAWRTFPPIGTLWQVNLPQEYIAGSVPGKTFENLKRLELVNLLWLERWDVHAPCQLFPFLEVLVIRGCHSLVELSFSHSTCCQQEKEAYGNLVPRCLELKIINCQRLLSFPPIPWSEAPCSIEIEGIGHSCLDKLVCGEDYDYYSLKIEGKDNADSTLWNVLNFDNLTRLKEFELKGCGHLPLHRLQMLSALRTLTVHCSSNALPFVADDSQVEYQFPVELFSIKWWSGSGKELTQLLTYFPKLMDLELMCCDTITGLGVMGQQAMKTFGPSYSSNESLLLLPPQLQRLGMNGCKALSIVPTPLDDGKNGAGGLQGLRSLRRLSVWGCSRLLSSYKSTLLSTCFPFPNSLEYLSLNCVLAEGRRTPLVSLSNLRSLRTLYIYQCDLTCKGLLSLLVEGHLIELHVRSTPSFFVVFNQELPSGTLKLQELTVDRLAIFTTTPTRSLLFSSLATLNICWLDAVERFTQEQESILFVSSLSAIKIMHCSRLKYLPAMLRTLPDLRKLRIEGSEAIEMLPVDGLPSSLQELEIFHCPGIRYLPKECLPDSLQKLVIRFCPAIRWVPKADDLPSSLREIDVSKSKSEELKIQCRKLINIIPIVKA